MRQHASASSATAQAPTPALATRRCACGGVVGPTGECAACRAKRLAGQRVHGQQGQGTTGGGGTAAANPIDDARRAAFIRTQTAYQRVAGIGPPPPPGRADPSIEWRLRARGLAETLFNWPDPNMDQVTEIVGRMRNYLATPSLATTRAAPTDKNCGNRAAYVVNLSPPIVLCPVFFKSSPEERTQTMVHEAAHLAGIGEPVGESYCAVFDCRTSCGGFSAADSWAHFVHCLSGQPAQQPTAVTGGQPARPGGRTP